MWYYFLVVSYSFVYIGQKLHEPILKPAYAKFECQRSWGKFDGTERVLELDLRLVEREHAQTLLYHPSDTIISFRQSLQAYACWCLLTISDGQSDTLHYASAAGADPKPVVLALRNRACSPLLGGRDWLCLSYFSGWPTMNAAYYDPWIRMDPRGTALDVCATHL